MTRRVLAAIALTVALAAGPARGEPPAAGDTELNKLAFLVGRWTAEVKAPQGSPVAIEVAYDWAGHKKSMKYTITVTAGGKSFTQYEGAYWWHPGKKQLQMLQVDRSGNVTESVARFEGDVMRQDNVQTRADGTRQEQRVELTRDGADTFRFRALVPKDGGWVEAAAFTYTRKRDAK